MLFDTGKKMATAVVVFCMVMFMASDMVQGGDWPMWRYDTDRSAVSPDGLPANLNLLWVRELPEPRAAWPWTQYKMQFDAAYEPIVVEELMYVGSMVRDSVTAYDTDTGEEVWRFYADGPVRFAPLAYEGNLYVVSDDGYLYCLEALTGEVVWKFRGGPRDKKILGNSRLVSMYPARGAPVVYDRKVYFAAGVFPFMGIFIHCLDAETGEVVWTNSGSGSVYIKQPHSTPSFAGVAPQGYMIATEDYLIVPGGRTAPACYDRKTGEFLYYRHGDAKRGAWDVWRSGDWFFNDGYMYRVSDGRGLMGTECSLVFGDVLYGTSSSEGQIYALKPSLSMVQNKEGKLVEKWGTESLWNADLDLVLDRLHIKAGGRLYGSSSDGTIVAIDIMGNVEGEVEQEALISWRGEVAGEPVRIVAGDDKLFVTTREGSIYCFGGESRQTVERYRLDNDQLKVSSDKWTEQASAILADYGDDAGYCISLGLGSGQLVEELVAQSDLHVIVVESDKAKVDAFRRKMDAAGLYGTRVAIVVGDSFSRMLPPYIANIIVSEDIGGAGFVMTDVSANAVFEPLRPYGGKAYLSMVADDREGFGDWVDEAELANAKVGSLDGFMTLQRVGALPGSADWSHQYCDAANSVCSKDQLVKAPLGLLWFGGPSHIDVLPRHGHGPTPQVVEGRLVIEGIGLLSARDVYTGRVLWRREFADLNTFGMYYDATYKDDPYDRSYNQFHIPGANLYGSNYVTTEDIVYLITGSTCYALDAGTGRTVKKFVLLDKNREKLNWGHMSVVDDLLIAGVTPLKVDYGIIKPPVRTEYPLIPPKPNIYLSDLQTERESSSSSREIRRDRNSRNGTLNVAGKKYSKGIGVHEKSELVYRLKPEYKAFVAVVGVDKEGRESGNMGFEVYIDDEKVGVTPVLYQNEYWAFHIAIPSGSERLHIVTTYGFVRWWRDYGDWVDAGFMTRETNPPEPLAFEEREVKPASRLGDVPGVELDASYASASRMMLVMDRYSGKVLWKREAKNSFRHNSIVVGDGKVFVLDVMSENKLAALRRRGYETTEKPVLYALDLQTGKVEWKSEENIFGTWLGYSEEYHLLVQGGSRWSDRGGDERGWGVVVYRGEDGEVLWQTKEDYGGPLILYHDKIIRQAGGGVRSARTGGGFNLLTGEEIKSMHPLTGEEIDWSWVRFYGCNSAIASEHLLTFRSGAAGYVDMTTCQGQGTSNLGGFKSGCTSNLVAANGVLNAPDYTRTCTCSYQNQTSLAMIYMPDMETWSFNYYVPPAEPTLVKRVGINMGAPGNRFGDDGTLWMEYPSIGGASPDVPVMVEGRGLKWFCYHNSRVDGELDWVGASGVEGVKEVRINLFLQPDEEAEKNMVQGYGKTRENVPTWEKADFSEKFKRAKMCTVRLYFAEVDDVKEGERVFDVMLQGKRVLRRFDIVNRAGGIHRMVVKEFKRVRVTDDLRIKFRARQGEALLCGVEVVVEE